MAKLLKIGMTGDGKPIAQPFASSGFSANVFAAGGGFPLADFYKRATFDLSEFTASANGGSYGRVSVYPFLEQYALRRVGRLFKQRKTTAEEVYGTISHPRTLHYNSDGCVDPRNGTMDALTEADIKHTSDRIKTFNHIIVRLLFKEEFADPVAKEMFDRWREDGRIHILDTHWMLSQLAIKELTNKGQPPPPFDPLVANHETLKEIAEAEGVDMTSVAGQAAKGDSDFMTEDFYRNMVERANVFPGGQQGLLGSDFIHPTRTTHAIVANAFMRLYREIALSQPPSGVGLLVVDDEKAKDPWRPVGEPGATP